MIGIQYERTLYHLLNGRCSEPNWDCDGSSAVTREAVEAIASLLHVVAIVPTKRGGLQFEFHALGCDFELEIGPDGRVVTVGFDVART